VPGVAAAEDVPAASPANATAEAERRQLTVMFCDLVGSTPLSTRFDPEDLREIVGVYHRCVTDTAGCFGGFVAKYMGDGVLIYFGYPEAHEDDAERAVRAGLAVIDGVSRLATSELLNVRIGIATGLVVGDLIGAGAAQERASSARRQTSQPACRRWPGRAPWSLPTAPGDRSARCSRSRISGPSRSPVSPMERSLRLRFFVDVCIGTFTSAVKALRGGIEAKGGRKCWLVVVNRVAGKLTGLRWRFRAAPFTYGGTTSVPPYPGLV